MSNILSDEPMQAPAAKPVQARGDRNQFIKPQAGDPAPRAVRAPQVVENYGHQNFSGPKPTKGLFRGGKRIA